MKKILLLALFASTASASATALHNTDRIFLANAVRGNNFEIEAAKLALRYGRTAQTRQFAEMMIRDHSNLGAKVKATVQRQDYRMKLPTTVTYKQADMLNALRRSGRNFDAIYRDQMIAGHRETYALFDKYSHSARANRALRAVIQDAKPTVRHHWNDAAMLPRY